MAINGWAGSALLVGLGAMSVWFARSPRLKHNPGARAFVRFIGLDRTRALLFGSGVLLLLLGLGALVLALTGATG